MNETNIKRDYSLMVHEGEARGAILNPGEQIPKAGQNLCYQGRNIEVRGAILGPPGTGFFLTMLALGGWTCQVMHSGISSVKLHRKFNYRVPHLTALISAKLKELEF